MKKPEKKKSTQKKPVKKPVKKPAKKVVKKPVKKLTKKQQLAIAIAKDVIKWVEAGKLRIKDRATYCSGYIPNYDFKPTDQIQPCLPIVRKHCSVCAKGAIFLSYVELKDNATFESIFFMLPSESDKDKNKSIAASGARMVKLLGGAFDSKQLDLIEVAFECWEFSSSDKDGRAYNFGEKHQSPRQRMIAICKNIIKNKGRFVP